jgi:hypothetical protein
LKLLCDKLLSNFAFNSSLCRYTTVPYTDVPHRTAAQLGVTACLMGPNDSFIRRQARVHRHISVSFHSL